MILLLVCPEAVPCDCLAVSTGEMQDQFLPPALQRCFFFLFFFWVGGAGVTFLIEVSFIHSKRMNIAPQQD